MSLTAIAFLVVYLGGICAALFNPVAGIVLYFLVYHIHPETQWWGSSVNILGSRLSFTVALATGVGMLVRQPRLPAGARQFPLAFTLAILFGLMAVSSLTWGVASTERGAYQAEKFAKILIFLFILIRCVQTPRHYQTVLVAWLAGVLYIGYQAFGGAGISVHGRLNTGLGGPDFSESSDLAVHLVATLPLLGAMFFIFRSWFSRLFVLVTGALTVNTLIMTRTRNVVAGLALMGLACVLALPRGYRLKGIAAVVVGAFLAVQLTDPAWWNRMSTITQYEEDPSAIGRLAYWRAAVEMANDHPFGIGLGNFHQTVMEYIPGLREVRGAHSTPMACLAELGWPGLFLFCVINAIVIWRLGQVRKIAHGLPDFIDINYYRWRTRFHLAWHATALRAALLGYLGCGLFTTRLFSEDYWLLIGMAMCLTNVAAALQAEQEQPETTEAETTEPLKWPGTPAIPLPGTR